MIDHVPLSDLLKYTAALSERDRRESETIMRALIRDYLNQSKGVTHDRDRHSFD